jgi:hypothetical protein
MSADWTPLTIEEFEEGEEFTDEEHDRFLASIGKGPLHAERQRAVQAMYNVLRRDLAFADKVGRPLHGCSKTELVFIRTHYSGLP